MPILTISRIHSFSSEDPAWPAANLLQRQPKKWRCKAGGEKKAFVCFDLEQPCQISGIDIGNEHSAHIAVQVARRGARDEDFQDILLATSFMSSAECRSSTAVNRVRCFHNEALVATVASGRWELLKVICTQPYNNHVPFGLAFVKVHAAAKDTATTTATITPSAAVSKPLVPATFLAAAQQTSSASPFAKFKMRADSSESDGETTAGSTLFARWKTAKVEAEGSAGTTSAAAAIRDSSNGLNRTPKFTLKTPRTQSPAPSDATVIKVDDAPARADRNRRAILYDSDDDKPNERLDRKLNHDRLEREKAAHMASAKKTPIPADVSSRSRTSERSSDKFRDFLGDDDRSAAPVAAPLKVAPSPKTPLLIPKQPESAKKPETNRFTPVVAATATQSRKRTLSPTAGPAAAAASQTPLKKNRVDEPPASSIAYKPFRKLLDGVVLVISGIQNPERGHVRDKALAMGAKYKPDWGGGCTHLICAYKNTPKYNQVHGHGKIITKNWITACHDQRKRLPWRRFALDSAEQSHPESEDEIHDEARKPASPPKAVVPKVESQPSANRLPVPVTVLTLSDDDDDAAMDARYTATSDYGLNSGRSPEKNAILSSGSDTEDELDRVRERQKQQQLKTTQTTTAAAKTTAVDNGSDSDSSTEISRSLRLKPLNVSQPLPDVVKGSDDDDDIYNKTTDEDRRATPKLSASGTITPLPEFYSGKRFYLSNNLHSVDQLKLVRYVAAYGGQMTRNAAEADYIVSNKGKRLSADFGGEVVRPLWVFECHDMECLLPTKRYKFE